MLSRARTLEGLLILRPATYDELNRGAPQYLLDEVDRLLELEKESTEDLKKYIENLPCQVPSEILELFRDNAESEELRRVVAVRPQATGSTPQLTQAVVPTTLDLHPRRRLRGKQVNPAAVAFQPVCVSEVQPAVLNSSTPMHADKRRLHATVAEDRAVQAKKRGIGSLAVVNKKLRHSEFNSAIAAANTPAGVRAQRYANAVNKRLQKANASRRKTDAVVFVAQPGRGPDISISSATDMSMRGVHGAQFSDTTSHKGMLSSTTAQASVTLTASASSSDSGGAALFGVAPSALQGSTGSSPEVLVQCTSPRNAELLEHVIVDVSCHLGYTHRGDIYVDPARAALHNPGNMCYLNSMLHVLARTPSIRNWAVQHRALNTGRSGHHPCTLCDLGDDLRLYSSIRFGIL